MLSKATTLDNLLIFDLPDRNLLEHGFAQEPLLQTRLLYLEQKALADAMISENIMRDELHWPDGSQYPLP